MIAEGGIRREAVLNMVALRALAGQDAGYGTASFSMKVEDPDLVLFWQNGP